MNVSWRRLVPIVAAIGLVPSLAVADSMVIAFDPLGEVTDVTTSAPWEAVTAYLLLLDPVGSEPINAFECLVDVQSAGPPPSITWTVAANGLNIVQAPNFVVGFPVPLANTDVVLLATATVLVPEAGQEIAFYVLPSPYPSMIDPPGYPVLTPVWALPPGLGFAAAPPASGCSGVAVAAINDDGVDPPLEVTIVGDGEFGEVEVGAPLVRTSQLHNAGATTVCGVLSLAGEGFEYRHGQGDWTTEPTWCQLAPGASLPVEIRFAAGTPGDHAGELAIACGEPLTALPLGGIGVPPTPGCALSAAELIFPETLTWVPADTTVTVINDGAAPLAIAPQIDSSVFSIVAGGEPREIAPGQAAIVTVRFLAAEAGDYDGLLLLGSPYCDEVDLLATAVAGDFGCDWGGLSLGDWGEQPIGSATERQFTFRNLGDYPLVDVSFEVTGAAFALTGGAGPLTLAPGASHVVTVTFSPEGPYTYTGGLAASAGACEPLTLVGRGESASTVADEGLLIAFDPLGQTTTATTAVPFAAVTAYLLLVNHELNFPLWGWECTVEVETDGPPPPVTWAVAHDGLNIGTPPEFIVGLPLPLPWAEVRLLATATILVPSPDQEIALHVLPSPLPSLIEPDGYPVEQPVWAGEPGLPYQVAASASGCATLPVAVVNDDGPTPFPQLDVAGDLAFGAVAVGTSATRTLALHNPLGSTFCGRLSLAGPGYEYRHGDGDWTVEPTWCRLAPGASRDVEVRFTPPGAGPAFGELIVEACGPTLALSLTGGGGAAPVVALAPPQVDFGFATINAPETRTCSVRNDGDMPLLFTPTLVEGDDFTLAGDPSPFLLEAGATHDVEVGLGAAETGAEFGRVSFGQPQAPDLLLRATVLPASGDCAVSLDGGGSGNCGAIAVGWSTSRTATIHNLGLETLSGDISLAGDVEAFTITSGGGWVVLPPGGQHAVTIAVAPPGLGVFQATLSLLSSCANVDLTVTGVAPTFGCVVEPDSLAFGMVVVGSAVADTVTVTNAGTVPLDGAASLPPGPFAVTAGGGDFTLTVGESRHVVVTFAPQAAGPAAAVLDLGADACADVPCAGTARDYGPWCQVMPALVEIIAPAPLIPVDFVVTVANQGELPLAVDPHLDADGFAITEGGGPQEVAAQSVLRIGVHFVGPATGVYTAVLYLGTEACTDVPITITVQDGVTACEWVGVNPMDFGARAVGSINYGSATFRNTGNVPLADVTFALAGDGFLVTSGAGPVTILPAAEHEIALVFIPTTTGGFAAELAPSVGCGEPLALLGAGQGALPSCSVEPGQVDFGPACVGSAHVVNVQVANAGPGMLAVLPAVSGPGFAVSWDLGYPLWLQVPPGATRNLAVSFTPQAIGAHEGVLDLGGSGCPPVPLTGMGIQDAAICTVTPEALDFGPVEIGYPAERQVQVTNDGCLPLAIAPTISGAGFAIVSGGEPGELGEGQTRTIVVRLTADVLGVAGGSLDLGGPDCPAVPLQGEVVPLSLSCYTLPAYLNVDFLPPSRPRNLTFRIHNAGEASVALAVNSVSGLAEPVTGGGSFTLSPGETRTVQARFFAPDLGQTIWQWSFGPGCRPLTVVVYGANAICHVRPAHIDFGITTVGAPVERSWVVSNPGIAPVNYTVCCDDPNWTWSPAGQQSLAPGHAFSGTVTYAPLATGTHDALLTFDSETAYPTDLHGEAVELLAARRFADPQLDFGAVSPGEALTRSCTLLNEGPEILGGEIALLGEEFELVDDVVISVPPGGRREVRVRYAPDGPGDHAATLSLAGADVAPLALLGLCRTTAADSNVVAVVWDDGTDPLATVSDLFEPLELSGRVVLREAAGAGGLYAWRGRLSVEGDGQFTAWQLPAGAVNRAEAPTFDVVVSGDIPPLAPEVTLASFRYLVPAGGRADLLLAGAPGEEAAGWPIWLDAAEPDSVHVAGTGAGHVVAVIRPRIDQVVPGLLRLHPPYPNPFNPTTTLAFDLGEPGRACLAVYDLSGRRLATVVDASLAAGRHEFTWQGCDDGGQPLPSGTYHVRLTGGGHAQTRKLSLIR